MYQDDPLMRIDELCDTLMICRKSAYKLLQDKQIKCFKINRVWKIPRQSVMEYIQEERNR